MGNACSSNKNKVKKPKMKNARKSAQKSGKESLKEDYKAMEEIDNGNISEENDIRIASPNEEGVQKSFTTNIRNNFNQDSKNSKKSKKSKKEKKKKSKNKKNKNKKSKKEKSVSILEESSSMDIPSEMSNSVEEDVAITGKIRSMTILSNGNKVMRNETPSDESNDSDDDIDDYQLDSHKLNISEESKRRGSSLRSNISKESYNSHNSILKLIDKSNSENSEMIQKNLNKNQYSLKTGLMMPIEEFVERNPDKEITLATFLDYTVEEELYGVFLAIDTKEWKLFKYLFEKKGQIWSEKHLLPILRHMIDTNWNEGISSLFKLNRTKEMFLAMYLSERQAFYDGVKEICEDLVGNSNSNNSALMSALMKGLVLKPYATLTFLNLFHYIHISGTKIQVRDVDPQICADDLYVLFIKNNLVYELAEQFDQTCNGDLEEKKKYRNILTKLIDYSFVLMPTAIPIRRIWRSIKIGADGDFENCCQEAKDSWPLVLTLRKAPSTVEFKQPLEDEKVKSLFVNKWKPLHLMIYYGRNKMIQHILTFAGRSLKKAMTIDNKKNLTTDEYSPLRIALRLGNKDTFKGLWNLAHQWSIMHLYQVMQDLLLPPLYDEEIFKVLLSDKTTQDILNYCDSKIKKEFFELFKDCIEENGKDTKKLNTLMKKLKKSKPTPMADMEEESSETHTSLSGE